MKNLIISKYNQLRILFLLSALAGLLLMFRIKISGSFYLLFLVWNVFLAAIPYGISFMIRLRPALFAHPLIRIVFFSIWLLFLPNAPYILSDFTHLRWIAGQFLMLDAIIISGFSLLGLLYMYYSICDMQEICFSALSRKQNLLLLIAICLLLGLGIYLGRYLRWNSWDLIHQPAQLVQDIGNLIIHPIRNRFAWFVSLGYAAISGTAITILNRLKWAH